MISMLVADDHHQRCDGRIFKTKQKDNSSESVVRGQDVRRESRVSRTSIIYHDHRIRQSFSRGMIFTIRLSPCLSILIYLLVFRD